MRVWLRRLGRFGNRAASGANAKPPRRINDSQNGLWCVIVSTRVLRRSFFADRGRSGTLLREPFVLRYSICRVKSEVFRSYLGLHLADSISDVKLPAHQSTPGVPS